MHVSVPESRGGNRSGGAFPLPTCQNPTGVGMFLARARPCEMGKTARFVLAVTPRRPRRASPPWGTLRRIRSSCRVRLPPRPVAAHDEVRTATPSGTGSPREAPREGSRARRKTAAWCRSPVRRRGSPESQREPRPPPTPAASEPHNGRREVVGRSEWQDAQRRPARHVDGHQGHGD